MTTQEVFNKITSEHKWYSGYCTRQYAYILKKRFNSGGLTEDKITQMFEFFGYKKDLTWAKPTLVDVFKKLQNNS